MQKTIDIMKYKLYVIALLVFISTSLKAEVVKDSIQLPLESYKLNQGYITSLTNKIDFYCDLGNYNKTIEIAEERQKVLEAVYGKDSYEYVLYQAELSSFYSFINKNHKAIELIKESIQRLENDNDSIVILAKNDMEFNLSSYYASIADYEKSLFYAQKVLAVYKSVYGVHNEKYISVLERVGSCLTYLSRAEEAITKQQDVLDYRIAHKDSLNLAIILCDISKSYATTGNYKKAISLSIEGQKILKKLLGEKNQFFIQALTNLSTYYEDSGDFDDAFKTCHELVETCRIGYGDNSSEYAKAISYNAQLHYRSGNAYLAIELEKESLKLKVQLQVDSISIAKSYSNLGLYYNALGYMDDAINNNLQAYILVSQLSYSSLYRDIILNLSDCYLKSEKYDEARTILSKAIVLFKEHNDDTSYYSCLTNMASYYFGMENYEKAISTLDKVRSYYQSTYGENSLQTIAIYKKMAQFYMRINRVRDAFFYEEKSMQLNKMLYGKDSPQYATSLSSLGNLLFQLGDQKKATIFQEDAANIIKNKLGTQNVLYLNVLRILSNVNDYNHNRKLQLLDEIKQILLSNNFSIHVYVSTMCELAQDYSKFNRYKDILELEDCLDKDSVVKAYFDKNQLAYAKYKNSFSSCFCALRKYDEALKRELVAYEIFKKYHGNNVANYDSSIANLIVCYGSLKDSVNLHNLMKETQIFDVIKNIIANNVQLLPSSDRFKYWKNFAYIYYDMVPYFAGLFRDNYFICSAYDNAALFAKGLLLRSETNILEIIKNHSDNSIRIMYDRLLSNYRLLESLSDINQIDSIKNTLNEQEDEIIQRLRHIGLLENTDVSWKDVQKELGSKDIAIEFISCNVDSVKQLNSALLLRKGYTFPKWVPIADKHEIDKYLTNGDMDSLYNVLWRPFEEELEGVENIYFSPSGELHSIPMEYLVCNDKRYMCEKFNLYRLSSTQKLVNRNSSGKYQKAVLYGGLDYESELVKQQSEIQNNNSLYQEKLDRGLMGSILNRNGFEPLINTQLEVSEIASVLESSNIKCNIFTGTKGIEETFKAMSGIPNDILHISTHGMYLRKNGVREIKYKNNFNFIRTEDTPVSLPGDEALSRSFLVMSGGNMLTRHREIPEGSDDGILTAKEISNLDLFGVDIVVLSACQTGLGDISGEGVYGLQRGFKKAGVNTILMSIDKVDDEATRILMVEFYKNLMNGKTKHQSLRDAQKYLRSVDNGKYDDPKYWASFIMLDGID